MAAVAILFGTRAARLEQPVVDLLFADFDILRCEPGTEAAYFAMRRRDEVLKRMTAGQIAPPAGARRSIRNSSADPPLLLLQGDASAEEYDAMPKKKGQASSDGVDRRCSQHLGHHAKTFRIRFAC
jgi:hypothetical protein